MDEIPWELWTLLQEADDLVKQGQYVEALPIARKAFELSGETHNVDGQVRASFWEGRVYAGLGDFPLSVAKDAFVIAAVMNPANQGKFGEDISMMVVICYATWIVNVLEYIPSMITEEILSAIDAAESYASMEKAEDWIPSFKHLRTKTLRALGHREQALRVAEEALASKRSNPQSVACKLSCYVDQYVGALQELGRWKDAVDFLVKLEDGFDFEHENLLMTRSLGLANEGDRQRAVADLRACVAINQDYAYPLFWIAGFGGGVAGLDRFAKKEGWAAEIASYFLGILGDEALVAAANNATDDKTKGEQICEAHGFIGLRMERDGDLESAREHYRDCTATGVEGYYEFRWAKLRLQSAGES